MRIGAHQDKHAHEREDQPRMSCRSQIKKKEKQCVQDILDRAMSTGVADITPVWRNFPASKKQRVEVALNAIGAVAKVKSV
jgi:hypothetical protein